MNSETLKKATDEAKRFLEAAAHVRIERFQYSASTCPPEVVEGTKESAACKRASLDLTRALAELRRSG